MRYVLVENNIVKQYPYSFNRLKKDNPDTSFPRVADDAFLAEWGVYPVKASSPENVTVDSIIAEINPVFSNGEWIQSWSVTEHEPSKEELIAYAKTKRWEHETGGINLNGISIATDSISQTKIIGARIAAESLENWSTVWDDSEGNRHIIDAENMILISNAVHDHVNNCFLIYAGIANDIDAGLLTKRSEIDGAFENAFT